MPIYDAISKSVAALDRCNETRGYFGAIGHQYQCKADLKELLTETDVT